MYIYYISTKFGIGSCFHQLIPHKTHKTLFLVSTTFFYPPKSLSRFFTTKVLGDLAQGRGEGKIFAGACCDIVLQTFIGDTQT